jgi:hypothetical protein
MSITRELILRTIGFEGSIRFMYSWTFQELASFGKCRHCETLGGIL